jgi:histidinol-phosphate/aromatic aminotransferase/cobyric acid decarboxylase-like protein
LSARQKYKGFVVVDEAYIDFADTPSLCTLVNKYKRLIVLQTLSKGFGLAGIRLGIAFGDPKLIQVLNNVKAPYNISKLASDVARKAFSNLDELRKNVKLTKEVRAKPLLAAAISVVVANVCSAIAGEDPSDQGAAKAVVRAPHLLVGLQLRAFRGRR